MSKNFTDSMMTLLGLIDLMNRIDVDGLSAVAIRRWCEERRVVKAQVAHRVRQTPAGAETLEESFCCRAHRTNINGDTESAGPTRISTT